MKIKIVCEIEVPEGFDINMSLDDAAWEFMPENEGEVFPASCNTIMNLCNLDIDIVEVREVAE